MCLCFVQIRSTVRASVNRYLKKGLSKSTFKTHQPALESYTRFIHIFGYSWICRSAEHMLEYATWLFDTMKKSWKSVMSYIKAVQSAHATLKVELKVLAWKPMKRLIAGLKRTRQCPDNAKRALDSFYIQKILNILPCRSWNALVIRTLITVAQNASLRVSEYTAPRVFYQKMSVKEKANLLRWKDVEWFSTRDAEAHPSASIHFTKSKTNPNRNSEYANLPCRCPGPCGRCTLNRLRQQAILKHGPNIAEIPIFQWANGRLVSDNQVYRLLKALCNRIGLNPDHYATHSLRKGGIVDAILEGCSDSVLLNLGRWKSFESIKSYIYLEQVQLAEIRNAHFKSQKQANAHTHRRPAAATKRAKAQHNVAMGNMILHERLGARGLLEVQMHPTA